MGERKKFKESEKEEEREGKRQESIFNEEEVEKISKLWREEE